jgi:VCBS repeat-containing protein
LNGTVIVNAVGTFTYSPRANFNGTDSFTFKVNDGSIDSSPAIVTITVNAVNDAPLATALSITTNEDLAKSGTLTATDIDSPTLTYSAVTNPSNGTVTITPNGTFTYTPTANFHGTDSFTSRANDGSLNSSPATVSITITPINDPVTGTVTLSGRAGQGLSLTATPTLPAKPALPATFSLPEHVQCEVSAK